MIEKKIKLDVKTAQLKAENFCAYQERCHQEIRSKLYDWGLYPNELEQIITHLISENFLNEERFAKAYARGKFNILHWGKMKIRQQLKLRNIGDRLIKKAMMEIADDAYEAAAIQLLDKKNAILKDKNPLIRKQKLYNYLYQKGYEQEIINFALKYRSL